MAKAKSKSYGKKDNSDPMFKAAERVAAKKGMSRFERMGEVFQAAQATYGKGFISKASKSEALVVPRASSGILSLDIKSNGGFPLRRVMMVIGFPSAGKTNMLLRGVSNAQKLCANCLKEGEFDLGEIELPDLANPGEQKLVETQVIVDCPCGNPRDFITVWIDSEGVWSPDWSEQLGVWSEKILLLRPQYAEQSYDFVCAMIASGTIDLTCIDSIAHLTPRNEVVSSMHTDMVGVGARVNNRFWRKLTSGMNKCFQETGSVPSVWVVNQYRKKIGVMYGPNDELTGGEGQKFVSSLTIECRGGKTIIDDEGVPIEGEFYFKITKNKVGTEGAKGSYSMCKAATDFSEVGDIVEYEEVIDMAIDVGLVEKLSQITYEYEGNKYRGKGQLGTYLMEHPQSYNDLKSKIMSIKLGYEE
jgi:RecA/RadA recombinase